MDKTIGIVFREAFAEDIPVVLEMMKHFNAIDSYPFDEALTKANLQEFIANTKLGNLWLIYTDDSLAGYIVLAFGFSFEYKGRDAFIDELYIEDQYRNRGLGSKAIDFVLEQAEANGVRVVHLEVEKHNEKAIGLYRNKHFSDQNRILLHRRFQ